MSALSKDHVEQLLALLVAEGEVMKAALKVLMAECPDPARFAQAFRVEVDSALGNVDRSQPKEAAIANVIAATRDRLLGQTPTTQPMH